MIESINLADVGGWTAFAALCAAIVFSLVKGWIVPGPTARMWFEAWQTDRHTVDTLADHVALLIKGQETITSVLTSIKQAGDRAERDRSSP